MERAVTLMEVLEAREARARRQQTLLKQYDCPLVSFTMNIAGPVKYTTLISRGFRIGCGLLEQQLLRVRATVLHREFLEEATGCEAVYVVDLPAVQLKALMVELEEGTDLGRLFDLDVLTPDGTKLDRAVERGCMICGKPGRGCARSRAHGVEELQQKTNEILKAAVTKQDRRTIAELTTRALLYEVCTTPKPGLVDRNNAGSHQDMDIFTFMASTAALGPYFETCAQIGQDTAELPPQETFSRLRLPGKLAEGAMLEATGGVNTHKGAVFTMGVLCGALGRLERCFWSQPEAVLAQCAAMTAGLTERDFAGLTAENAATVGQKLFLRHGIAGIRGQIEAGLPAVLTQGLPALETALRQGKSRDEAGTAALLALIASTEDTNLIARGGLEGLRWARAAAERMTDAEALDRAFIERNLSPGGCADLLAVCWLLYFLQEQEIEKSTCVSVCLRLSKTYEKDFRD